MQKISWNRSVIILEVLMICLEVLFAFLVLLDFAQKNVKDFITYTNQDYGIKIGYPENWKLKEEENIIKFFPLGDVYLDTYPEHFVIIVIDYNYLRILNVQNLDAYARRHSETLEELLDDVTILELYRTFVDYDPAIKFVYTGTSTEKGRQYNLKAMEVIVIRGKRVYHFVYWAEVDEYSDFLWIAELMVDKIDFIEE